MYPRIVPAIPPQIFLLHRVHKARFCLHLARSIRL